MAKIIAETGKMSEAEWLELRKGGIGGSDAAAVAGVSKYASPLVVYMEKRGTYKREVSGAVKEAAEWGHIMEPVLRDEFKRRINEERKEQGLKPLWIQQRNAIFAHEEYDFMRTNLDGQIFGHEAGKGILEIKTASEYLKDDWEGEDVPNQYYIQVQHNMKVMEADFAYLVRLIGGNKYKHYYIERDEETIETLVLLEKTFWDGVLNRIPPAGNGADSEKDMYNELYPESVPQDADQPPVQLPIVCAEYIEQVDALKELQKQLKQEQTHLENEVKAVMGTSETAFAGNHKITWKTGSQGRRFSYKLDATDHREKFFDSRRKEIEKETKAIEKEIKAITKERKALEKQQIKMRKEADKAANKSYKEAKKQLKAVEKDKDKLAVIDPNEFFATELYKSVEAIKQEFEGVK